jgi:hypothetical protein
LAEARTMARDAMRGLIEVMLDKAIPIPESDGPEAVPRFNELARTLQDDGEPEPIFEQLGAPVGETV